jgi:hypothetical protein
LIDNLCDGKRANAFMQIDNVLYATAILGAVICIEAADAPFGVANAQRRSVAPMIASRARRGRRIGSSVAACRERTAERERPENR